MNSDDKFMVIDYLFNYNLELISEYSVSIHDSLIIGWQNYVTSNKNSKYKNILEKHLSKLEKKKIDVNGIKRENENILEYLQSYGLMNNKYKNLLINAIKDIDNVADIFRLLLKKYNELVILDKRNKNEKLVFDMPYQVKVKDYCVKDKDGYTYYHVKMVNGSMVVVDSSLKVEKQLYNIAIQDKKELFKDSKDIKLAPFEKKRRIYIENVFNLERLILDLGEKNVDVTYPIEKFYEYSLLLVDGLYKELTRKNEKKDIFDYIMSITVSNFNYENVINTYANCVKDMINEIKKKDEMTRHIFGDEAIRIKKNHKYADFKNVAGLVPVVDNIYSLVNKKIINKLHIHYQSDTKLMEEFIVNNTRHMTEKDIVEYYKTYKDVLNMNKSKIDCYKVLQKTIIDVMSRKFQVDERKVLKVLLKEEKIY